MLAPGRQRTEPHENTLLRQTPRPSRQPSRKPGRPSGNFEYARSPTVSSPWWLPRPRCGPSPKQSATRHAPHSPTQMPSWHTCKASWHQPPLLPLLLLLRLLLSLPLSPLQQHLLLLLLLLLRPHQRPHCLSSTMMMMMTMSSPCPLRPRPRGKIVPGGYHLHPLFPTGTRWPSVSRPFLPTRRQTASASQQKSYGWEGRA